MKAEHIKVIPFNMEQILSCEIKKEPNEHGQAYLRGYLPAEEEESCLRLLSQDTGVEIQAVSETGESRVIFRGRIKEGKISRHNQLLLVEINLITNTHLLDRQKKIRSFQVPGMSYQDILDTVVGAYPGGGCILAKGQDRVTEEMIVQYQETDWEFLKRLASHLQTVVVPEVQTEGVRVYVGLPQRSGILKTTATSYTACKRIQDYLHKQQNQVEGLLEEDELCYELEEQEVLELGEQIELWGRSYHVVGVKSYLDGHQLWNSYLVKKEAGLSVPKQYNEGIVGASMDGRIREVQEAKVKVKLSADGVSGEGRWFPFSTVYSSPDGSGWYCMPEVGDEIRLYFPTIKEKHAYVISSVHLPVDTGKAEAASVSSSGNQAGGDTASAGGYSTTSGGASSGGYSAASSGGSLEGYSIPTSGAGNPATAAGGARSNPEEKILLTETGKMVKLTPTQIHLSNAKGMDIILDDEEGILILSDKRVSIRSKQKIELSSGEGIKLMGMEQVRLRQKGSSITLKEEKITLKGAEVHMQ